MTTHHVTMCKICASAEIRRLFEVRRPDESFDLLECSACGMHFIDYLDDLASLDAPAFEATVEETEAIVAAGLESSPERIERNVALLERHAPSGSVLDIGSGGGGFLARIKAAYGPVVGLELDPRYVGFSRARGLDVVDRPLESSYWDDHRGSFDVVTMWDVIEHVNDPLDFCRRAHQLLKPGGVLLIDTPNRDGLFYRFGELTAKLSGGRRLSTMGTQYSAFPFCHKQIFRKRDMLRALELAGFSRVSLSEKFELSFPPEYYMRRLIPSKLFRKFLNPVANLGFKLLPIRNKLIVAAVR